MIIKHYKKVFIGAATSLTLILAGCGSSEELDPGISKYKEGSHESMVEAREFFVDYLKNNPGDKDAEKWLNKSNDELVETSKVKIEELYDNRQFEEALKLSEMLYDIDSKDEEIIEAKDMIEKDYKNQKEFDKFAEFAEEKYDKLYKLFENWNDLSEKVVVEDASLENLEKEASEMLPEVSEIRDDLQKHTLTIKDKVFLDANEEFFEYMNETEKQLTDIIVDKPESFSDYKENFKNFTPDKFNKVFIDMQNDINEYLDEVDEDGDKVNNIQGEIIFIKEE